jgi:hypothetical protein
MGQKTAVLLLQTLEPTQSKKQPLFKDETLNELVLVLYPKCNESVKASPQTKRQRLDVVGQSKPDSSLSTLAKNLAPLKSAAEREPLMQAGLYVLPLLTIDQH